MSDHPIDDILRTAIQREIDAFNLYSAAAKKSELPHVVSLLKDLAAQEVGHRHRLEALLAGNVFQALSDVQRKKVVDLKIADYLVEVLWLRIQTCRMCLLWPPSAKRPATICMRRWLRWLRMMPRCSCLSTWSAKS